MIEGSLASKLFSLSKTILKQSEEIKINKVARLYIKLKVDNADNSTIQGSLTTRQESLIKEELNLKDVFEFLERVKNIQEYSSVASYIPENYKLNYDAASDRLNAFIRDIIFDTTSEAGWNFRNGITDSLLIDYITIFNGDLEGNPPIWNVTLWIEGISYKGKDCKIIDNLLVREIKISELELEVPFDEVLLMFHPFRPYGIPDMSGAILEFKHKGLLKDIKKEIDIILTSLMIFRLGSVYSKKIEYRPNSFVHRHQFSWKNEIYATNYKYDLKGRTVRV